MDKNKKNYDVVWAGMSATRQIIWELKIYQFNGIDSIPMFNSTRNKQGNH